MKIYLASDLHIGSGESNIEMINVFLDLVEKNADTLILVGDVFDIWVEGFEDILKDNGYKNIYDRIVNIATRIPVIYIFGNHDFDIGNEIKNNNIKIVDHYQYTDIFIVHGHQFDTPQMIGSLFYSLIERFFPYISKYVYKTPHQLINNPLEYYDRCKKYHDAIRAFRAKNGYRCIICGHSHNPLDDINLVDCGDFTEHCSYVIIEDGIARLKDL